MAVSIRPTRGNRAGFNGLVSSSALVPGQIYAILDEKWLALATGPAAFIEVGRGDIDVPDASIVSAIRAGTGDGYLSPPETWAAHAPVAVDLTALDMATFITGTASVTSNTTIANPSNPKPGQSGWIRVNKGAANTLSFAAYWKPNGPIDVADATYCTINYVAVSATEIQFSISRPEA